MNSLAYVRIERNLSPESVAVELDTSVDRILKFESGEAKPTVGQLRDLSEIYGVSDYLLVTRQKPNVEPLLVDFRKDDAGPLVASARGLNNLFAMREKAFTLAHVRALVGPAPSLVFETLSLDQLEPAVTDLHALFRFDPTQSRFTEDVDWTYKALRHKNERLGAFTFTSYAPPSDYRGFFDSVHRDYGLVYINKGQKHFSPKAKLFTWAHEFAHYLTRLEGASDPFVVNNEIERTCNRFASEFLCPKSYFEDLTRDAFQRTNSVADRISFISSRSLLSKGAAAYRLVLLNRLSRHDYEEWRERARFAKDSSHEDPPEDLEVDGGSGGHWAYNVVTDNGIAGVQTVERALEAGVIDEVDASRLLNARGDTLKLAFKTANNRAQEIDS